MYAFSKVEDFDEENNPFSCYLCDVGFKDEVSLRKHVENCGKTFYCAKCNDNFKSNLNLEEHIISVHDGRSTVYENKNLFDCGICQLTFTSKQTYFTHISSVHVSVHDVKEPILDGKDNVHARKNDIERTSSNVNKENYFQRNFFKWKQELSKEEYVNEKEEVYVHEEKEYVHEGKELIHEETKPTYKGVVSSQDQTETSLDENNIIFEESDSNIKHVELFERKNIGVNTKRKYSLEPNEKSRYPCPICNDIYINVESLTKHISSFHEKQCLKCDLVFSNRENLQKHVKSVHGYTDLHQCKYCNMKITTQFSLKRHISTVHEKIKPYECAVCKRCFSSKQVSMRHAKVHEGKNKCHFCDIIFYNLDQLKDHILQFHPAEGKSNTSKKQILDGKSENHIEINEIKIQGFPLIPNGDAPLFNTKLSKKKLAKEKEKEWKIYQCNLCSIICSNKGYLKNHIQRIHVSGLTKNYLCEACNMSFMSEELFTEHARIIHNETHENVEIQEVKDLTVHEKENPQLSNFTS